MQAIRLVINCLFISTDYIGRIASRNSAFRTSFFIRTGLHADFGSKIIGDVEFVWNNKNIAHIAEHGISRQEAEYVVEHAKPPYPQMIGEGKRMVVGQIPSGEYVQVIYVPARSVPGALYVMHARTLTDEEKRRFRRRMR